MKYFYKIFVNENVEKSLQSLNAPESFITELIFSADYKGQIEQGLTDFYVGYDLDKVRKGKISEAWTWCPIKKYYSVNGTYKGEVHPNRSEKINKLKDLWKDEN